jgi:hypothetical protein
MDGPEYMENKVTEETGSMTVEELKRNPAYEP